jgi:hypothetical protein
MTDHIGSAHMSQGAYTNFTYDRFGNENSALALNGGWTQVPQGIYFNTPEFTISAWVYPQNIGYIARLIDFGNGFASDNIFLKLDSGSSNYQPGLRIYNGSTSIGTVQSSKSLLVNKWQLLTATFNGNQMLIYINGTLVGTNPLSSYYELQTITRLYNYIGQSNYPGISGYSNLNLDDLRFYNKSLTQTEIIHLMNDNSLGKNM